VGVPRTEALVRLYDVLNANQDWLPRNLGTLPPVVKPKGIDDVPVLGVTLWSRDTASASELERVASTLEAELKRVPGTREVQTIGGPGMAVHVTLDPAACASVASTCSACSSTLAAANMGHARRLGDRSFQQRRMLASRPATCAAADEVGDLVVGVSRRPVYLREVARIEYGAAQPQQYVWFTPGRAAPALLQQRRRRCQRSAHPCSRP
jgi:multidrug efflux pump subunit AcrB